MMVLLVVGRFCSRACANSHSKTIEQRQHISEGVDQANLKRGIVPIKMRVKQECKDCGKILGIRNRTGYCNSCRKSASELYEQRVQAGKKGILTKKQNGTLKGWQTRNIQSYPEQFWQQVLDNNNIKYEGPNKVIKRADGNCYFLDFYIEKNNKKVDLEIDGKQHKYTDRIESDKIRDNYLKNLDYIVYRIDWNEINSKQGSLSMKNKIDAFLVFYNTL